MRRLAVLDEPLPEGSSEGSDVLGLLDEVGSPATVANAGGRYFGFVIGGALPVAVAANWLAGAWDQCASSDANSPVAAALERVAARWVLGALGLPSGAGVGFVTGTTMGHFTVLAAARHALLARVGWDEEERRLFGAPPLRVVVSDEVHVTVLKALRMLGLGSGRVERVPTDGHGRMRVESLPRLDERTLVCVQAGNVNTGACDPIGAVCERAAGTGAWVHVGGAFGLWAAAAPALAHLVAGSERADSWAVSAHKWLNVPYDSGLAICRDAGRLRAAMTTSAAYLEEGDRPEPMHHTPEFSRRARGVEVWAALKTLGRRGLADLVERNCRQARYLAAELRSAGIEVLNGVDLNQVLVAFGDREVTRRVLAEIQREGTLWCGGTEWQGRPAARISICSWATTDEDVDQAIAAVVRAVAAVAPVAT